MRSSYHMIPAYVVTILVALVTLSCAVPAAQQPLAVEVLKIGRVSPISGPGAQWGQASGPVMDIYADEINKDGGLNVGDKTYKIELYVADGPIFPPSADVMAARSLVYDKGIHALIGYIGLAHAPIAAITNAEKVIFNSNTLNMGVYNPERQPYTVFGYPNMEIIGFQAVQVMRSFPQARVLCWTGPKSGNQEEAANWEYWDADYERKYGFKCVRIYYPEGTTSFTPYLQRMAEQKADVLFTPSTPTEVGMMAKQIHQLGYKFILAQGSPFLDLQTVKGLTGSIEAMQNMCGDYSAPWVLKNTRVSPKYLDMADRIRAEYKKRNNGKEPFVGAFSVPVNMMGQYLEAVQMAGSIDPDKVMKAFRGGTFETFLGKYTLSGQRNYGSPVVFGYPCAMSVIRGEEQVYIGENPMLDVDNPAVDNPPVPSTSPQPIVQGEKPLSFKAATYTVDQFNISIKYPADWRQEKPDTSFGIFLARAPQRLPVLGVSVFDTARMTEQGQQAYREFNATNIKETPPREYRLPSGEIIGQLATINCDIPGAKLILYNLSIDQGEKIISINIVTLEGMQDEDLFKEIFNTLKIENAN